VLIEELAVFAALEEAHQHLTGNTVLRLDGDAPTDAGSGVIVQHDRKGCGRHGQSRRRKPKPGAGK
jgi:hypothetical protein